MQKTIWILTLGIALLQGCASSQPDQELPASKVLQQEKVREEDAPEAPWNKP